MLYLSSFFICGFSRELVIALSEWYELYFEVVLGVSGVWVESVVLSMPVMSGHKRASICTLGDSKYMGITMKIRYVLCFIV